MATQGPTTAATRIISPGELEQAFKDAFPFEPYSIQVQFMTALHNCVEQGQFGLFESPTGTGKTLSIICGLLTWLRHHRARQAAESAAKDTTTDAGGACSCEPAWLDDQPGDDSPGPASADENCKPAQPAAPSGPKIIYAARTHSQLSQFMEEFRRVDLSKGLAISAVASRKVLCINPRVQSLRASWRINDECLQLQSQKGAKKQAVAGGAAKAAGGCGFRCKDDSAMDGFVSAIAAGAMDIEDLATHGRRRAVCPYYAARAALLRADVALVPYSCLIHKETREALGLDVAGSVVIIDEAHNLLGAINGAHSVALSADSLASMSELLGAYYARFQSRLGPAKAAAVTLARGLVERVCTFLAACGSEAAARERVLLPNEFLLDSKLANVNLLDLVGRLAEDHLTMKLAGFAESLASERAAEAVPGLAAMTRRPDAHVADKPPSPSGTGREPGAKGGVAGRSASAAAFQTFTQFLRELSSSNAAGRIIVSGGAAATVQVRYVLLDASSKFAAALRPARAVVLASGTLAPLELLTAQLFSPAERARLCVFQCGHVVAPERVLAVGVGVGPRGHKIKLTHGQRGADAVLDECGAVLLNLCRVVPEGLVAFVPSFAYCELLRKRWEATTLDAQLRRHKKVLWEGKDPAACNAALAEFRATIEAPADARRGASGALLVCVIGAKLSEGINFGDGLGRCVVVFGLPYPDLRDAELRERLRHIRRIEGGAEAGAGGAQEMSAVERKMYTNMCMQAVNQCVGRAIRHVRDYAAVVLVDARYTSADAGGAEVFAKLPGWLTQRWVDAGSSFGPAIGALGVFYRSMKASADQDVCER